MNKLMLTLLLVGLVLLIGCVSSNDGSTPVEPATSLECSSEDIVASLTRLHGAAMPEITGEIEALESRIATYDEKIEALLKIQGDITGEISFWDSVMKEKEPPYGQNLFWYVEYTEEECKQYLSNEYYEVVEFKLNWQWSNEKEVWEIYSEKVQVRNKETSDSYKHTLLDTVIDNLTKGKSGFVDERNDKSNAKDKATQVLNDALANKDAWEIEEVSEKVYSVNGYGLGYGEDLAMGSWYYYIDTGYLEPRDPSSIRLRDVLTASLEEPAADVPTPAPAPPPGEPY